MKYAILFAAWAFLGPTVQAQQHGTVATEEAEASFKQGEAAYRAGGYAKAVEHFTHALTIDPDHLNAYLQRGFSYSIQGEYKLAIADFTSVLERKPDHLWAYTSRGSAYAKMGRNDLAMADFNKVLELDPHDQEAYNNRGWAKKAEGDLKGACSDWKASRKMGNEEAKIILKNNNCR